MRTIAASGARFGLLARLAAGFLLFAVAILSAAAPARSHATLIGAEPADGTVVESPPAEIRLQFNEAVRPIVARLIGPDGRAVALEAVTERGADIAYPLSDYFAAAPEGARGSHVLSWRAVSSDGHPIAGGVSFAVGAPGGDAFGLPEAETGDPLARAGLWLSRLAMNLGLIFGAGGAFWALLSVARGTAAAGHAPSGAGIFLPVAAGLAGTVLFLGFQGLDVFAAEIGALLRFETWRAGLFATRYGLAAVLAVAALGLAALALRSSRGRPGRMWTPCAAVGLAALTYAVAGHAPTAPPRILTAPVTVLHALAAILWVGALVPLSRALARSEPGTGGASAQVAPLERFSRFIPAIIALLLVTGAFLAAVQVHSPAALWRTDYGRVLMAKLGLVASMLLLAAWNRYRLTAPAMAGRPRAITTLRRAIRAEILLACLVIAVLGLWRFTPPPRALPPDAAPAQSVEIAEGPLSATLTISPDRLGAGPARVTVTDLRMDGAPFAPLEVAVTLEKPAFAIGPFTRPAEIGASGFTASGFVLPMDGFWVVRADVLVDDFRRIELRDMFDIGPAP